MKTSEMLKVGAGFHPCPEKGKNVNGITLVALIITIIVMLILVGVSVKVVINSNLIGTAQEATHKWEQAQSDNTINNLGGFIENYINGMSEPLYSFGVLSDVHIGYQTSGTDYANALDYLENTENVEFTCVTGDIVDVPSSERMAQYRTCLEESVKDMPIYEITGNHESYAEDGLSVGEVNTELWINTTGDALYYSFTHGNDVYIMVGSNSENASLVFKDDELEWLEQILESNKDKRCFVFQHYFEHGDPTADPYGAYWSVLQETPGTKFISLMKHYENAIWFHGHSHLSLLDNHPSVGTSRGYRSVHVPSVSVPRDYDSSAGEYVINYAKSEGYVVDVYENKIVLRGIDFTTNTIISEETLDTTLKNDIGEYVPKEPTNLAGTITENYRISSSGTLKVADGHSITDYVPCVSGDTIRVRGLTLKETIDSYSPVIGFYDSSKNFLGYVYCVNEPNKFIGTDGELITYYVQSHASIADVSNVAYIRIDGCTVNNTEVIVTVNEPIM